MKLSHEWSKATVVFDETNIVSLAGLAPVMGLAEKAGLRSAVVGAARKHGARFSVVLTRNRAIDAAIASIAPDAWTPVRYPGAVLDPETDLGTRLVRAWAIVPAAVNERDLVPGLIEGARHLRGLLNDKGFNGKAFTESLAEQGITNLVPPTRAQRTTMSSGLGKVIAQWRNRVQTTFFQITDTMELARHGAHTFHGLLTRTAATIAAHTITKIALPAV